MQTFIPPPKKRGFLRQRVGRLYFTCKRFAEWYFSDRSFAYLRSDTRLPCSAVTHRSEFMRPLKKVDMYLQENKKTNIRLASQKLNGLLLQPGETFSFWRLVGRPSRFAGYLDGLVLSQGNLEKGVGGGLCQLSNLIYWMTLHTPLRVVERWRHSYDVFPDVDRKLPFGSGATVAYNYIDLQIFNPTTENFQLGLWQDDAFLYGEWRCEFEPVHAYAVYEQNHRIESHYWGGYTRHNELYRRVTCRDSDISEDEFIAANNVLMMYNPLLEGKAGALGLQK